MPQSRQPADHVFSNRRNPTADHNDKDVDKVVVDDDDVNVNLLLRLIAITITLEWRLPKELILPLFCC